MSSLNQVTLIGNIGQDPEVRYTPNGNAVCNLSLATSRYWKDKNTGEKMEDTEWHRIQVWGQQAEVCGEYVRKGSKISVVGRLKTREYEKDGEKRYSTEVVCEQLILLSSPQDGGERRSRPGARRPERPAAKPRTAERPQTAFDDMDDDIPFN